MDFIEKIRSEFESGHGSKWYDCESDYRDFLEQRLEAGQQETIVMPHQDLDKLFQDELEELINRYCQENESNTPDFILAEYMKKCLDAFNESVHRREAWYGREAWHGQSKDNKK